MTSLYNILKANRLGMDSDPWIAILGEAWKASEEEFKEYTGLVPYTFIGNGQPLIDWYIKGDTVQSGSPTPSNPVDVNGVGERTGNLFDISTAEDTEYYINNSGDLAQGTLGDRFIAQKISVKPITEYTFSWGDTIVGTSDNSPYIRVSEYVNTEFLGRVAYKCIDYVNKTFTVRTGQYATVLDIRYDSGTSLRQQTITNLMINSGSTALPYEPYGYKILISSAGQAIPVYLGEVKTTRRIKKLVLDGTENWSYDPTYSRFWINVADFTTIGLRLTPFVSNAFTSISDGRPITDVPDNSIYSGSKQNDDIHKIFIKCTTYTSLNGYKSYLQQQYANGTPVTIWYILTAPETGAVNEPLMKIGEYSDTISMTDTGIEIPTNRGRNTIDIETDVKPSEFYMKWKER